MLLQAGHTVVTAADGAEAARAAISDRFDVILMDVQMPEMDGYASARAIRQALPGTPVAIIALTANALAGEADRCLAAGMDMHVAKPVHWPTLFAAIDRAVQNRKQIRIKPSPLLAHELDASAFDRTAISQLRNSIGAENALGLLNLFASEARHLFTVQPESPEARSDLCREAHRFAGSAGMLGFTELAEACIALESAGDHGSLFAQCLERCRQARDAALRSIDDLVLEITPVSSTCKQVS